MRTSLPLAYTRIDALAGRGWLRHPAPLRVTVFMVATAAGGAPFSQRLPPPSLFSCSYRSHPANLQRVAGGARQGVEVSFPSWMSDGQPELITDSHCKYQSRRECLNESVDSSAWQIDMQTRPPLFGCCLAFLFNATLLQAYNPVIVHEWGTFTCLQDEYGKAIQGVNVDDEPVPQFVYENAGITVFAQYSVSQRSFGLPPYFDRARMSQGWFRGDPQVTMRLETPVLYIYPPKGQPPTSVLPLDVHVDFHGGILSQSYPYAEREDPPHPPLAPQGGITNQTISGLTWKGVRLGSTEKPVDTDEKVWTTPRAVNAPLLEVKAPIYDDKGGRHEGIQAEHFLFYRGVGHLDSPVFVQSRLPVLNGKLSLVGWLSANGHTYQNPEPIENLNGGWTVQIRSDGRCAFHAWPGGGILAVSLGCGDYVPPISGDFTDADFAEKNVDALKSSMHAALVKEGLYDDEATAMLKTWELSYFKSPGLRFFYLVPRAWVDEVLPLKITGAPTDITRVMVGRIELITDAQEAALARLAAGPCPDLAAVKKAAQDALQKSSLPKDQVDAFYRGEKPLSELGISLPPLVQDYLSLGRFRDALIVHEQQQHPSSALAQFIKDNHLSPLDN